MSNYIVKDAKGKEIQADKDVKWKIFYASDKNVYLKLLFPIIPPSKEPNAQPIVFAAE